MNQSQNARITEPFNTGWRYFEGEPAAAFSHIFLAETGTTNEQGESNWHFAWSEKNTGPREGLLTFDPKSMPRWCLPDHPWSCVIARGGTGDLRPQLYSLRTNRKKGAPLPRVEWVSPHPDDTPLQISFSLQFGNKNEAARILKNGELVWEYEGEPAKWLPRASIVKIPAVDKGDIITFMPTGKLEDSAINWLFPTIHRDSDFNRPAQPDFADADWTPVTLPRETRTARPYMGFPAFCYEGTMWYRKHFTTDPSWKGKKLFLEFESANITADVWVNGKKLATHLGGFLPFTVDITDTVRSEAKAENVVAVRVSNWHEPDIPSKTSFGGINGDVRLHVTDKLHITDTVYAQKVAGGGVFITTPQVSDKEAKVLIKTHLVNEHSGAKHCFIETRLLNRHGNVVATLTGQQEVPADGEHTFSQTTTITAPDLWHPDHPHLYTADIRVMEGRIDGTGGGEQTIVDAATVRFGIRSISFSRQEGFKLNGKPYWFRGANYNAGFPYIGTAAGHAAIRRDVKRYKELGFNYLRPSPEARPCTPAWLDACDEFGLLVLDPINVNENNEKPLYNQRCYQMMRDLIRRDRNHPCVIAWELSLNEKYWRDPEFSPTAMKIGHSEYPGDQCYVAAWKDAGRWGKEPLVFDIHIATPGAGAHQYEGPLPVIVSEYGHWEFVKEKPEFDSDCLRGHGEVAMLSQARNQMSIHNINRTIDNICGDGLFTGTDYLAYDSGIQDMFRLPKFSAWFWRSQRDPALVLPGIDSGPMVKIANYWTPDSPRDVTIFSNCDAVRLTLNGEVLETRTPDRNESTTHVERPPFTFPGIVFAPGELKAEGLIGEKIVATDIVRTPGEAKKLSITSDAAALLPNGDVALVWVSVLDAHGTVVPDAEHPIALEVVGPAELIGPPEWRAEAGIAGFLIRSRDGEGVIQLKASTAGLENAAVQILSEQSGNP